VAALGDVSIIYFNLFREISVKKLISFAVWLSLLMPGFSFGYALQAGDLVQTNSACDLYSQTTVVAHLAQALKFTVALINGTWISLKNLDGTAVSGWVQSTNLDVLSSIDLYENAEILYDSGKALTTAGTAPITVKVLSVP